MICATLLLSVQCLAVVEITFIFVYCCNQNKWIVRCSNSEIWLNLPTLLGSILTKMSKPFSFQMFSRLIWKWIQTLFIQEKFSFSLTTGRKSSGAGDLTQKLPAGSRTLTLSYYAVFAGLLLSLPACTDSIPSIFLLLTSAVNHRFESMWASHARNIQYWRTSLISCFRRACCVSKSPDPPTDITQEVLN